jgi:hypothetical protein
LAGWNTGRFLKAEIIDETCFPGGFSRRFASGFGRRAGRPFQPRNRSAHPAGASLEVAHAGSGPFFGARKLPSLKSYDGRIAAGRVSLSDFKRISGRQQKSA